MLSNELKALPPFDEDDVAPEHRLRLAEIVERLATRAARESRLNEAA